MVGTRFVLISVALRVHRPLRVFMVVFVNQSPNPPPSSSSAVDWQDWPLLYAAEGKNSNYQILITKPWPKWLGLFCFCLPSLSLIFTSGPDSQDSFPESQQKTEQPQTEPKELIILCAQNSIQDVSANVPFCTSPCETLQDSQGM